MNEKLQYSYGLEKVVFKSEQNQHWSYLRKGPFTFYVDNFLGFFDPSLPQKTNTEMHTGLFILPNFNLWVVLGKRGCLNKSSNLSIILKIKPDYYEVHYSFFVCYSWSGVWCGGKILYQNHEKCQKMPNKMAQNGHFWSQWLLT